MFANFSLLLGRGMLRFGGVPALYGLSSVLSEIFLRLVVVGALRVAFGVALSPLSACEIRRHFP